jgi:hypothetical protein
MQSSMGTEKLSLREAIDINLKQLSYVTLEGEEGEKIWAESRGNFSADESRLRTYIQGSYYSKILESYLERFPKAQIKVIFLEDIKNDFDQTISSLFSFLEVDPTFVIPRKEIVNFHFDRKANKITNKLFGVNGTRFLISITPKFLKRKMKSAWRTKETPKLSHEDRLYLWSIFKEDVTRLEKLVDRDLSHWTPPIKEVRALA